MSDERVKLDLMFKMALSTDLVKGLIYIHRSAIEYHGNLTSSNCLVDDHWTLKLTDFGIRSLRRTLGDNVLKSGRALIEGNDCLTLGHRVYTVSFHQLKSIMLQKKNGLEESIYKFIKY